MKPAHGYAAFTIICSAAAPNIFKKIIGGMEFSNALFWFLFFASLSCFGYLGLKKKLAKTVRSIDKKKCFWLFLAGVTNFFHYFLFTYSLSIINAVTVIVLVRTSPIFQILISRYLIGQKIKKLKTTTTLFAVGLLGVLVAIVGNTKGESLQLGLWGNIAPILAGLCSAVYVVSLAEFVKGTKEKTDIDEFQYKFFGVGIAMTMSTILALPYTLAISQSFHLPNYTQLFTLLFLGVVPTALSSISWQHALSIAGGVSRIANLEFFIPVLGVLIAYGWLKEDVSLWLVVGFAIITASVYANKQINPMQK